MCVKSASGCEESGLPTGRARFSQSCKAAAGSACQSRARVRGGSCRLIVQVSLMSLKVPGLSKKMWLDVYSKDCPPAQSGRSPEVCLFVITAEVSPDACNYPEYEDAFCRLRI